FYVSSCSFVLYNEGPPHSHSHFSSSRLRSVEVVGDTILCTFSSWKFLALIFFL
ncbi:uncharacterized protein A4U43_C04F28810, partial [Asparagus officinalis]